jgi:putative transposase
MLNRPWSRLFCTRATQVVVALVNAGGPDRNSFLATITGDIYFGCTFTRGAFPEIPFAQALDLFGLPAFSTSYHPAFDCSYTVYVRQAYRHSNTTVSLINFHFVWCPKRRRKVLTGPVERDLRRQLAEQSRGLDCEIVALEIMPDHVHLFLNCPPSLAPNEIMHQLKGSTSRALRLKYAHLERMDSLWTRSYFCSTAGNVSAETVRHYIENQKTR